MGEVRQTNFRVDQDTADKFREFCAAAGMNQAQGFDHVMQVLELDRAKEAVPSRATEIEEYEMHVKAIMSISQDISDLRMTDGTLFSIRQ